MTYKIPNAWILNGLMDYLRCPRKEISFDNFFSIEQGPSNVGKLNWDLLGFFHSYSVSLGVFAVCTTIEEFLFCQMEPPSAKYFNKNLIVHR